MNKLKALPMLYIGSTNLKQLISLQNKNIEAFIRSATNSFGLVVYKTEGGSLSEDLLVSISGTTGIFINGGYCIDNKNGEIIFANIQGKSVSLSGYPVNTTYYIYVVPKLSNYESGTLTFTNGSKVVSSNVKFSTVSPYSSILIEDSVSGNNGIYQIASVNTSTIELTEVFTGTTEANLKWKVIGRFTDGMELDSNDTIFEYDSYDIVVSSNASLEGYMLAKVLVTNSGELDKLIDKRGENLFKLNPTVQLNADNILTGSINAVTTLEEKAKAARVNLICSDLFTNGLKSGSAIVTTGLNNELVRISSSDIYYDGYGNRILLPSNVTLNLYDYVSEGKILPGVNYLYIRYQSPNTYSWIITTGVSNDPYYVLIAKITDRVDVTPRFLTEDSRIMSKLKAPSFISQGKGSTSSEGEIYYKPNTIGKGKYYFQRLSADGVTLEEIELITPMGLQEAIENQLGDEARTERLRFSFYPFESKDSWYLFNGLAAPTVVGYDYTVVKLTRCLYNSGFLVGTTSKLDYPAVNLNIAARDGNPFITQVLPIGLDCNAGTPLGMFFTGNDATPRTWLIAGGERTIYHFPIEPVYLTYYSTIEITIKSR